MKESGEMYLETIYILKRSISPVRAVDVVEYRHLSKPSVSRAMGILKNDGYISVDSNGAINLTTEGTIIAEKIYERHILLTEFLEKLGVSHSTAEEDACRIEHDISDETFLTLKNFYNSKL